MVLAVAALDLTELAEKFVLLFVCDSLAGVLNYKLHRYRVIVLVLEGNSDIDITDIGELVWIKKRSRNKGMLFRRAKRLKKTRRDNNNWYKGDGLP